MSTTRTDNSVRSMLSNVSLLGGMQVFLALINVLRGKFVAIFLGPDGMGVSSLFNSSSSTIAQASSLGLNMAIVKEVAQVHEDDDRLATLLHMVFRLVRATALLGALFTALFSGWLSRVTFGTPDYAWQFVLLAFFVYFTVAAGAKAAVLQGLQRVKELALASMVGALTGLLVGVPLYWRLGNLGIVPAMVCYALAMYIFNSWRLRRYLPSAAGGSKGWREHRPLVLRLLKMGCVLMMGNLINQVTVYGLNLVLRTVGNIDQVGLYQAANSISAQYVGVIISALALDYFPRLSAAASDNNKMNTIVNRQLLLVLIAMVPLGCLIIVTAPLLIRLLLTEAFLSVSPLVMLFGVGVFFKLAQYPLCYVTFAKNNNRLFLILEGFVGNILFFCLSAGGYLLFGLEGIGYGMIVENIIFFVIMLIVNGRLYGYRAPWRVLAAYIGGAAVCAVCALICMNATAVAAYVVAGGLTAASVAYAIVGIRRMLKAESNSSGKL